MRFTQIQIDYYPGSHGMFLDYLINRFLLSLPVAKTFNPLTFFGSSHNTLSNHDYQIRKRTIPHHESASQFVREDNRHYFKTDFIQHSKSCIIRIDVNTEYLAFYNRWATVYDHNIDLDTIEIDTQEKFGKIDKQLLDVFVECHGDKQIYDKHDLAQHFFWTMDQIPYYPFNRWADTNLECMHVKMDNFFHYHTLLGELKKIAAFIDSDLDTVGLASFWQEFISKNKAYRSWCNVREIIKKIESGEEYKDIPTISFEQAYVAYYAKTILKDGKKYYDI